MAPTSRTHLWQTMLAGQWKEIGDRSLQDALEAAHSASSDGYRFSARGYTYEVDFSRMKQVNTSTRRERGLRRVPDPSAPALTPVATSIPSSAVASSGKTVPAKSTIASTTAAPKGGKMVPATTTTASTTAAPTGPHKATKAPAATSTSPPAAIVSPPVAPVPAAPVPARLVPRRGCTIRQGRVKTVLKEKGFGFILLDGEELFFHVSIPGGDAVQGNDIVEVEVPLAADLSGRKRAKRVQLLRRGSIMKQMCKNKCCLAKGERHWEDHCPRGGSGTAPVTTAVAPTTSALATTAAAAPKTTAASAKATSCPRGIQKRSFKAATVADTTKTRAVRLQNRFQFADDDDDDKDGKTDDESVSTDCS